MDIIRCVVLSVQRLKIHGTVFHKLVLRAKKIDNRLKRHSRSNELPAFLNEDLPVVLSVG